MHAYALLIVLNYAKREHLFLKLKIKLKYAIFCVINEVSGFVSKKKTKQKTNIHSIKIKILSVSSPHIHTVLST